VIIVAKIIIAVQDAFLLGVQLLVEIVARQVLVLELVGQETKLDLGLVQVVAMPLVHILAQERVTEFA
jgi:hypothetical protein